MMKALVFSVIAIAAAPRLARADGWIHCNGPDKPAGCSTSGADAASVGSGLLMIAGVAYGLARRKRR